MKRLFPILLCGLASLLFGCNTTPDPVLTVSPENLAFSAEGGAQTVQVKANNPWTASASGSGISVNPSSGDGDATVTVTASATSSTNPLSGTVTFRSEGLAATVSVTQDERKVIQVGDVMVIPSEGGTFAVDIQYNTEYTVEVEASAKSWISFLGTRALQSGKLEFQFAENGNAEPRTGKVTVRDNSGKAAPVTLNFVQEEKKVITVGDVMTIPAEGGTFAVDIQYNTDFDVVVESGAQSWITFVATRALKSGKLEFRFAENQNTDPRQGKVTVKDKSGKVSDITLTFVQEEKKVITVGDVMEIPAEGGSFAVDVQYNTDVVVEVEPAAQSWIHFVAVRALTSGKLEFSFDANPNPDVRTGKVTVKDKNGKVSPITLTFVQEEKKVISVGDVMEIPAEGGTFSVDVQYNTDVVVEVESAAQSWIKFVAVRALTSGKLEFSFDANPNPDVRTGKVTVKDKNGKVSPITLTFVQEEKKVISVGDVMEIPAEGGTFSVDVQYNTDFDVVVESGAQSWIKFVAVRALTSGYLEFSFDANPNPDARTGKVTVKDKNGKVAPITLTFNQAEKKVIAVGDVMEIPAEGGTFAVDVQYNTDVVVEVEPAAQSWIQFVAVRALTSGKLEFSFDANPNPDIRSGKVTVKDKNGKVAPTTLTFVQAEKKVITVGDVMTIPAEGGTFAVDIQYNTDFDVVVESGAQSWIHFVATRALQSGKLEFQFAENQNTDPRQGKVTVKDKSGKVSDITLTFVQEEKKVLTVGDVMTIPAEGGTFSVDVQYNTDVVVEVESAAQSWIHFVAVRALTSGKLEFSFDANPNPDVRTGKVTVRDKNGKVAPTTLVFTQAEKKVIAIVDVMEIPAEGGTFAVDVQYNTDFDVVVEAGAQSWIHFVAVRALTSGKLEFSFDENPSIAPREGKVTVKDKNGKVEPVTLTFVQEEKKVIQVGNVMTIPAEGGTFEVDVEYNTDVVVEVESAAQSWIHFVAVRALSSGQLEFSFDANPNPDVRTGKVTVRDKNGKVSPIILTFEQEPFIDVSSVRDALIAFYEATGGENWINNDNWCSDKPFDEWFGISTSETGYVISILLENNNLSGSIPESLFNLKHLEEIILTSNNLSGEFSDRFWSMPALKKLDLSNNKITGQLTSSIRNAKKLTWLGLGSNFLTGTIPEELSDLEDLWYFSIENVPIVNGVFSEASNSFSGVIPDNLDKLRNLEYFLVEYNNLEGSIPACFGRMPKLTTLIVCGNRLSGKIPVEVYECDNWDDWAPDANIIPQQEGYTLSFDYYQSTDYSNDGKVIRLQTHQKGNGISIVITGDCFTDKDIAAGDFERIARETMEDFFSIEPFTTFRNLFDVYAVIAVSKTTYVNYGTAFNSEFGLGAYVYCDEEAVKEYTRKAIDDIDETLTIVIVNKNKYSGTSYLPYPMYDTDYGTGFAYACFGLQAQSETRRLLINHEANGHGFTKLADEYYYSGSGAYPEQDGEVVGGVYFPMGFFANIEFGWNCPANVKWSRFLTDERYKYDGLGVFEGGYTYEKGVWRPSENSIMGHQGPSNDGNRFNAPSRQAAYYRIHKLAYGSAWEFDYEEFVKYDAINRKTSSPASPARIPETGVVVSVPHTPPVIMKKPDAR